jgi:hypothetical protein
MFVEVVNRLLENDRNLKQHGVVFLLSDMMVSCICYYDQGPGFQTSVQQHLRYCTHLADALADIVRLVMERNASHVLLEGIIR